MIVAPFEAGWLCVTQPDHARLSRRILELWRSDPLPDHPRRSDLLFATGEHDNGWQEADSAPRLAASGDRPAGFLTYPNAGKREIWLRGILRHRERNPYAAALIAEHAVFLHASSGEKELVELLAQARELRDELATAAAIELDLLSADYRWLHLADLLSLVACGGWTEPCERWGFEIARLDDSVSISPFPLVGTTTFEFSARTLPKRSYAGDADLAGELATARWREHSIKLTPASEV